MGVEDRDYYRDESYSSAGFLSDTPACRAILVATIAVFVLQILVTRPADVDDIPRPMRELIIEQASDGESEQASPIEESLSEVPAAADPLAAYAEQLPPQSVVQDWLQLETDKVLRGQIWRLATCALVHDRFGIWHIVLNMLMLYWFGPALEGHYGSREFSLFYAAAAIAASVSYLAVESITGDRFPAIGASGAVMAVVCVFAIWNPGYTIRIYFLFPIPIGWLLGLYVLYDLHPVLLRLSGTQLSSGVAHAAHLGGLAFGYLYWRNHWLLEPYWDRLVRGVSGAAQRRSAAGPRAAFRQNVDTMERRVDELLDKISREGKGSLSEQELAELEQASRRYRRRNA